MTVPTNDAPEIALFALAAERSLVPLAAAARGANLFIEALDAPKVVCF